MGVKSLHQQLDTRIFWSHRSLRQNNPGGSESQIYTIED